MGDLAGMGPEVTAKVPRDERAYQKCRPFVVGSTAAVDQALRLIEAPVATHSTPSLEEVAGQPGAIDGRYDVVIAMYHDQRHIPIKVHHWAGRVSVNLGPPFIRTSVDHVAAFGFAGKGVAGQESMLEAIRVAVELANDGRLP